MNYRKEIDGLRALAVIPVILFHAGFQTFSGGFVGVDVFFVISGYLITSIILAEKQAGTFTLIGFYERRARRILPALFIVMFACLPVAWLWLLPSDMKMFSQSLVAVPGFASNILFYLTSGYFEPAAELKPLLHTWSLAVEEQFYLLHPFFLLAAWRLGKIWIVGILAVVAAISLIAAQWGSLTDPTFTFFLLPTRGWEILIGALVAFYLFRKENEKAVSSGNSSSVRQFVSIIGLLLCAYAVFTFDQFTPYPSFYALIPTIGTAFIILFATQQTLVGRFLSSKLLVGIGLISYSAYLWHYPLFAFARHRSIDQPGRVLFCLLAAVSLLFAYFSWKYVETPIRNRQCITRNQVFRIGALCSFAFVAIGLVGQFNGGYPYRVSEQVSKALSAQFDPLGCLSEVGKHIKVNESCVSGEKANVRGALLGDSVAGTLSFELGKRLESSSMGFSNMTFGHCPPILDVYRVDMGSKHRCPEHNKEVFDYLRENKNYETVILAGYWTAYLEGTGIHNGESGGIATNGKSPLDVVANNIKVRSSDNNRKPLLKEKYLETLLRYIKTGKQIILVYPIPEAGWNVPRYSAKLIMFNKDVKDDGDLTTSYEAYRERNKETINLFDSVGEYPNLVRIKPETIFCNGFIKDRCVSRLNGVSLYRDEFHLSNTGARLIVDEIMKHITK